MQTTIPHREAIARRATDLFGSSHVRHVGKFGNETRQTIHGEFHVLFWMLAPRVMHVQIRDADLNILLNGEHYLDQGLVTVSKCRSGLWRNQFMACAA